MFADMKIGRRLLLAFGAVIALMLTVAFVGATRLSAATASTNLIVYDRYAKVALIDRIYAGVSKQAIALRDIVLASDAERQRALIAGLDKVNQGVDEDVAHLGKALSTDKGKAIFESLVDARESFESRRRDVVKLVADGKPDKSAEQLASGVASAQTAYCGSRHTATAAPVVRVEASPAQTSSPRKSVAAPSVSARTATASHGNGRPGRVLANA